MSRPAALLLATLGAALVAAPAAAANFTVDAARSTLLVRIWKEGAASALAHDHVARASKLSGTVRWDPAKPNTGSVEVTVETNGLMMDEPNLRKRLEMPPIADVNRREIQNTMRGPLQLDVAKYPAIAFRSQRVDSVGEGKLRITGAFTLHGVTKEVTFPATIERRGEYLHANGGFRFLQSDYGIKPYSFRGAVANRDEVELQVELLAK
ncbi:MAG TPA: YceI family protein [Thermoanaerobaculia bacterium]|nr:YceI family protein [Thermoanaerobaculia bacterium]